MNTVSFARFILILLSGVTATALKIIALVVYTVQAIPLNVLDESVEQLKSYVHPNIKGL